MAEKEAPETPEQKAEPKEPPYFEQFTREFRSSPEAKKLYGHAKMEGIARAYLEAEGKLARAIVVPDGEKPDPAEVTTFRKALGIPEKPEEYELESLGEGEAHKAAEANFRKLFHQAALSKTQAKTIFDAVAASQKAGQEARAKAEKERGEAYKAAVLAAAGGEAEKVKEVEELYRVTLAKRFGSKSLLEKLHARGLLDDPEFATMVIQTGRLLQDDRFIEGAEGGKGKTAQKVGTLGNYSQQWIDVMGGKK